MSCLLHASELTYAKTRISLYPAMMSYCSYFQNICSEVHMAQTPQCKGIKTHSEDFDEPTHRVSVLTGTSST